MEQTKEAIKDNGDDDLYFDDMDYYDDSLELDLGQIDGLGRIPRTRFTELSIW